MIRPQHLRGQTPCGGEADIDLNLIDWPDHPVAVWKLGFSSSDLICGCRCAVFWRRYWRPGF